MTELYFLSIITITTNDGKWLPALFESLRTQTETRFEAIVFDNASSDDSVAVCERFSDVVSVVRGEKNMGFAGGNNAAATKATGTHLFFLNPDTLLPPTTIAAIYDAIRESPESVLAPLQLHYDSDDVRTTGLGIDVVGYPAFPRDKDEPFFADGAALVIPASLFHKLNGFDERHFVFHEDIDLCWRAQLLGHKVIACWSAIVRHYSGGGVTGGAYKGRGYQTTWFRRFHGEKNTIRNLLKNYSAISLLFALPLYLLQQGCEIVIMFVSGRREFVHADIAAIWWNIRNFGETMRARRVIQTSRVVSDWKILRKVHFGFGKWYGLRVVGIPKGPTRSAP